LAGAVSPVRFYPKTDFYPDFKRETIKSAKLPVKRSKRAAIRPVQLFLHQKAQTDCAAPVRLTIFRILASGFKYS
jgi:hypothetical protein